MTNTMDMNTLTSWTGTLHLLLRERTEGGRVRRSIIKTKQARWSKQLHWARDIFNCIAIIRVWTINISNSIKLLQSKVNDGDGLVLLTSFNLTILSAAFYNRGPPHFISISGLIGFNRIDLWYLLSLFNVLPWLLVVAMVVTNFRNVWNSFHKAVHDSFKSCPLFNFHLNYTLID